MKIIYDCNECPQISITESEQQKQEIKMPHIGNLYGMPIYHRGKHPILPPPEECGFSEHHTT